MNFRGQGLCRADFLELRKGAQAGWLGLTRAAAGGGEHCENGNDECGNNTDHGVGRFCLEILKNARMGKRAIISTVSHSPACWVRERRSGSRRRREMRRWRRSGRFSSVGRNGWWFVGRHVAHASLRARLAAGFLPARQNTAQKPDPPWREILPSPSLPRRCRRH